MLPILALVVAVALGVTWLAPQAWLVLLTDGLLSMAVVGAAAGWGAWPTAWLGFGRRGLGQQFCIAAALGFGLLSTLTLVLGVAGLLTQVVAWTLVALGGVCGLWRVYAAQAPSAALVGPVSKRSTSGTETRRYGSGAGVGPHLIKALVLVPLAVPIVIAMFGATLPPGVLWPEEAFGYDVLEYHLQAPREYFDAGQIMFLPHNVYASFPQQMEMLYLLLMHMADDAHAAAIPSQLLHAIFGGLAVLALAAWTKPGWGRVVVMLAAGTTPWLAYLGCLAYVENGVLFFAAVAAGLALNGLEKYEVGDWRLALAAGLCAGLAGGCKYTGLVFVGVGLGLSWAIAMRGPLPARARRILVFGLGALLAFSPWLIRNTTFTGNPVYPFAYERFGGTAWSADQDARWQAGHSVAADRDSAVGRLELGARELFGAFDARTGDFRLTLFGVAIFPLALAGLALRRSREAAMLVIWGVLITLAWLWLTFIPGRFAMVLIAPAALLAGRAISPAAAGVQSGGRRLAVGFVVGLAILGAIANDWLLSARLNRHNEWFESQYGAPLAAAVGQTEALVANNWLNQALPPDAFVWLIGDARVFYVDRRRHYSVVFSQDPWLEYAHEGHSAAECVNWLRERGATHVVFVWNEIERLRASYGFSSVVTPEWVATLETAGLQRMTMSKQIGAPPGAAVYEVSGR